jgi:hypothetical protein
MPGLFFVGTDSAEGPPADLGGMPPSPGLLLWVLLIPNLAMASLTACWGPWRSFRRLRATYRIYDDCLAEPSRRLSWLFTY